MASSDSRKFYITEDFAVAYFKDIARKEELKAREFLERVNQLQTESTRIKQHCRLLQEDYHRMKIRSNQLNTEGIKLKVELGRERIGLKYILRTARFRNMFFNLLGSNLFLKWQYQSCIPKYIFHLFSIHCIRG